MTHYILYHQVKLGVDCPDGIAAAWVASLKYPDAVIKGATYQALPPIVPQRDDRVTLVDFSFSASVVENWLFCGVQVEVIDHHKTALETLEVLGDRILQKFDMNECGATLAWKTLFPDEPMPAFLEFVRSRDLWLDCELFAKTIPDTLIVHEAIALWKKEFGKSGVESFGMYTEIAKYDREGLLKRARAIALPALEQKKATVMEIASRWETKEITTPDGHSYVVPVVILAENGSEDRYTSDVCMVLYQEFDLAPFCACIVSDGGYSLRSNSKGNNTDVAAIAKQFGGGGHRNAAGFKLVDKVNQCPV